MGEYALLLASFEAVLYPKKFHCYTCITQYGKTPKMVGKSDRNRRSKGCYDFSTKSYRIENIKYNTCVGNFVKPIEFLLEAFSLYEKGVLTFNGKVGDQPAKLMECFNIFEQRRYEKLEKEAKNG